MGITKSLDEQVSEYFAFGKIMARLPRAHYFVLQCVSLGMTYEQIAELIKVAPSLYHRGQKWTPKHIARVHKEAKRLLGEFVV